MNIGGAVSLFDMKIHCFTVFKQSCAQPFFLDLHDIERL